MDADAARRVDQATRRVDQAPRRIESALRSVPRRGSDPATAFLPMPLGPGTSELTPTMVDPPRMPARIDTVRRQFDRRAARFGGHDALLRVVAARMHERLEVIRLDPRRILDAGCGRGSDRAALLARYPRADWVGIDLSPAMLAAATADPTTHSAWSWRRLVAGRQASGAIFDRNRGLRICADAARLPLADEMADLVYSNLMLHWHPQPHSVFPEWHRALRQDGVLMFSCFGPDTLKELRAACADAGLDVRPMPFVDMHDFGDMMVASGLATPVMDAEVLRLTFRSPRALLAEVRALGGNPRDDRRLGLSGSRSAAALLAALEARRAPDGTIGLTFEIAYGHAWKRAPRAPGAAAVSLESLRASLPARGAR